MLPQGLPKFLNLILFFQIPLQLSPSLTPQQKFLNHSLAFGKAMDILNYLAGRDAFSDTMEFAQMEED